MAHYINAPIDCLCASTSVETDAQLGWENMGSFLPQMLVGTDIICAASATSVDKVSDPLALLVGNEMAGYARHITKGVTFDDASIPVEMMIDLGHAPLGGNFLETDHTFEYYRRELWQPSGVTNRLGRDAWMESGETSIRERTSALADEILANHEPDLPEARQKQLRELIAEILDREGVVGEEAKRVMEATYWQGF
jgi:trimethylamine--corrinoid protein Co-methyltransferase